MKFIGELLFTEQATGYRKSTQSKVKGGDTRWGILSNILMTLAAFPAVTAWKRGPKWGWKRRQVRQGSPELPDCLHHGENLFHPKLLITTRGTKLRHPTMMNDPRRALEPSAQFEAARRTTTVLGRRPIQLKCTLFYNLSVLFCRLCSCVTDLLSVITGAKVLLCYRIST